MLASLLYGRGTLDIEIPSDARVTVIRKPDMPVLKDPAAAVRKAIDGLPELARGGASACIAICDITRPVPNHLFLRPLVDCLTSGGISEDRITILIATGLHRPNLGDELAELVGDPWVLQNIRVINHDAQCDADHVDLGSTSTRGTPVKLDRRFVEADVRIATGLVEPHFMAGYSGGRKVIAPGLAHADTIKTFHNHAFMSDPAATNCNLLRNPLHEEQLEIVKKIGGAFALNTVIDEQRRLSMVNFGEVTDSHAQAVAFVKDFCRVPVPHSFGTVISSGAGYPLDKTYYQTVKGMVGAAGILLPGGNLIIASECSEGIGSAAYTKAQKQLCAVGPNSFLDAITGKPFADIDEWQTQMQTKAMSKGVIHLYSSLSPDDQELTGVESVEVLSEIIRTSIDASDDKAVAVIPEGPYVVPYVES